MSAKANPLVFRTNPEPLQEMAAVGVAVILWRREIKKIQPNLDTSPDILKKASPQVSSLAEVPAPIKDVIDTNIVWLKELLVDWIEYHYQRIFAPHGSKFAILKYFDEISWGPDGIIDYKKTAQNLIARSDLNIAFKHRLACNFCLEEEIRKIWPKVQVARSTQCKENYLYAVFYWDMRMNNKLIDPALLHWIEPTVDNWPAVSYFFNLLKPRDRKEGAANIIMCHRYVSYCRRLLPMLTKRQLDEVIEECPEAVITDLAYFPKDAEYAVQTWRYMSRTLRGAYLIDVFKRILSPSMHERLHVPSLLYDMWMNTAEHVIKDVLENYSHSLDDILEMFLNTTHTSAEGLNVDIRFVLELLRIKSPDYRFTFWNDHWTKLIIGLNSDALNELMKLCLESDEKVAEFKKTHMIVYDNIEDYCTSLAFEGLFNEITKFLNFCTSDQTIVKDLKRKILWSNELIMHCLQYLDETRKMLKFEEFIGDVYVDEDYRKSFKCHMVTSSNKLAHLRDSIRLGALCQVKKFVQLFLTRDDDLQFVKNCFAQFCRQIIMEGKFSQVHVEKWDEFLLWCLNDDKKQFIRFKRSIPIDYVFDHVFKITIKQLREKFTSDHTRARAVPDYAAQFRVWNLGDDNVDENPKDDYAAQFCHWNLGDDNVDENPKDKFDNLNVLLMWYFTSKTEIDRFKKKKSATYTRHAYTNISAVNTWIKSFFESNK